MMRKVLQTRKGCPSLSNICASGLLEKYTKPETQIYVIEIAKVVVMFLLARSYKEIILGNTRPVDFQKGIFVEDSTPY
jgi:hypothetical protein